MNTRRLPAKIMLNKLLEVQEAQRSIIRKQTNIIDEMFVLLCNYMTLEELEPLLNSIKEVADKEKKNGTVG